MSTIQSFRSRCDFYDITIEGNPYQMFMDHLETPLMEKYDTLGYIEITDRINRMKGTSYVFNLTELGVQMLKFDQL